MSRIQAVATPRELEHRRVCDKRHLRCAVNQTLIGPVLPKVLLRIVARTRLLPGARRAQLYGISAFLVELRRESPYLTADKVIEKEKGLEMWIRTGVHSLF